MTVAGDFNAHVGRRVAVGNDEVVGQNARGQWMENWSIMHSFDIANATPGAPMDDLWTFRRNDLRTQLDYV